MTLTEQLWERLLAGWPVARLASVSAAGKPHCVPVVFCAHDASIYSPLDSKRKRHTRLKRFDNLAANPNASMLIDEYARDWRDLWWVRVDGRAELFEPEDAAAAAIATALMQKYPQYRESSVSFERGAYLRLQPTIVRAWAQSGSPDTIANALDRLTAG